MTAIAIHAVLDGTVHMLDTRERMFAWFSDTPRVADYHVTYRGRTFPFDDYAFALPTSPSDLVSKALARIPGQAVRGGNPEWSLLSDYTKGQCGWLALALAERTGGRTMACGLLTGAYDDDEEPQETDTEWYLLGKSCLDGFMHAGVLIGSHVYCALGRNDPGLWAYGVSRCEDVTMCGLTESHVLRSILDPLPEIVDTIPDVVELLVQLVGDEDEPRHLHGRD